MKLKRNAKHIPAVQMNNCFQFAACDVTCNGRCRLHLSQAVEGEERVSPYLRDAVALGNLTVAQRNGSTSITRLTRGCKQMTHEMSKINPVNIEC